MISYVEDQFLLHHSSYLNENFSEILNIAFKRELWKKLQTYCLDQICPNPSIIFASPNFLSCKPSIGEYHEEKMINEIVDKWSDKDFESLKERLKNCIPYIRFSDISPEDFFVRIRPLKKIFPDDVYEEVLWKYVNPKNVIFVNKREKEIQQEETLNFNARNNDKESSFPYLINYRNSLQPSLRNNQIDHAIYSYANCGPQWGGNDLRAWGSFNADCCQCVHLRYEEAIRNNPDLFSAEEFEVFQLVKK
ncbi:9371_t:CDS:2 [Rhizophagus irregularis]|nr:9371_t:CDS:2 [Rhizophagus irregularis]